MQELSKIFQIFFAERNVSSFCRRHACRYRLDDERLVEPWLSDDALVNGSQSRGYSQINKFRRASVCRLRGCELWIVRKAGEQLVIRSSRLALFKEIDAFGSANVGDNAASGINFSEKRRLPTWLSGDFYAFPVCPMGLGLASGVKLQWTW